MARGAKGGGQYRMGAKGVILDKKGKRVYGPEEAMMDAGDTVQQMFNSGPPNRKYDDVEAAPGSKLLDDAEDRLYRVNKKKRLSKRNPQYDNF